MKTAEDLESMEKVYRKKENQDPTARSNPS